MERNSLQWTEILISRNLVSPMVSIFRSQSKSGRVGTSRFQNVEFIVTFFQISRKMNSSDNVSNCWSDTAPLHVTKLSVLATIFILTFVSNVLILVAILSLKQKVIIKLLQEI